jgi:tetratricopeptide (TPR) repeat protein
MIPSVNRENYDNWKDYSSKLDHDGKNEEATTYLQLAAFARPDDIDLSLFLADRLCRNKKIDSATIIYSLLLTHHDENTRFRALLSYANCLAKAGNFELAQAKISMAISIDSGSHWPLITLAETLVVMNRSDERLAMFDFYYHNLRPDGKAEIARYVAGLLANDHFQSTRSTGRWVPPHNPGLIPALSSSGLIMMVKDEADIITQNLSHHYSIGFRNFCILDNKSSDNTKILIEKFQDSHKDAIVLLVSDCIDGYYQSKKMEIFHNAFIEYLEMIDKKLEWMFFIDADEFISFCGVDNGNGIAGLTQTLGNPEVNLIVMHWLNASTKEILSIMPENYDQFSLFSNITTRLSPIVPKVAIRVGSNMVPMMGNHFVENYTNNLNSVQPIALSDWYLLHYPLRSLDHVRKKVINGGEAFKKSKGLENHGGHWKERFDLYNKHGESIIGQILKNHIDSVQ